MAMSNDERLAIKRLIELARTQSLQMGAFDTADHLAQADLAFDRFLVEVEFRNTARDYGSDWTPTAAGLRKSQIN